MNAGTKALVAGATAGLLLSFDSLADLVAVRAIDDIGLSLRAASAAGGLLAGAVAIGLSRLNVALAPSQKNAWIAAGAALVLSLSGLPAVGLILPIVVGYGLGIYCATLLPENAGMGRRLGVAFGTLGAVFVSAGVGGLVMGAVAGDPIAVAGRALMFTLVSLVIMNIVLKVALKHQAHAGAPQTAHHHGVVVQGPWTAPHGWMWAKLNDRKLGIYALGYRYIDPVGGPSFHVVADLRSQPSAESLRRAGYRGDRTVRLGEHETLYVDGIPPELVAFHQGSFEEGGVTGAVVMALTKGERSWLGLPDAPPWAQTFARAA